MNKTLKVLIIILLITLTAFVAWMLFRDRETPITEALRDVLPFGSGEGFNIPRTSVEQETATANGSEAADEFANPASNLFRLTAEPVAGVIILRQGTSTVVARYADRATGHIYDVNLKTLSKAKVTNQTLPKIYEAYFRPDGAAVLYRSLKNDTDTVENMTLTLTPPSATSSLHSISATLLRGDMGSVAVGAGNTLFYSLADTSSIASSAFNGTGLRTLASSAFTDWRLAASGASLITYTKASAQAPGYAYRLNTANGSLTKLLGPLNGLVVVPDSSGNRIAYSYIERGQTQAKTKNLQSGQETAIYPVTLAEKCVWSILNLGVLYCGSPVNGIGALEPDNWYKGATSFSDSLWRFDTNAEIAQILAEPGASLGTDIDVLNPKLSPAEDYLVFMNKRDLSLWVLKLEAF